MLIKTMKLRLDELALYVMFDLGGFLLGSVLLALITYFGGKDENYTVFRLGTVMAWIIFCFLSVIMGMVGMGGYFNWHVGFGRTRKSFFLCDLATEFCWNLVSLGIIGGFSLLEGGILKVFYSVYPEGAEIFWGPWLLWLFPVFALLLTIVREFTGSILMRFGNKAFWVMWALWMFICLVPGKLEENKNSVIGEMIKNVTMWIRNIPVTGWLVMGISFVLFLTALSWLIIRKQAVKG